MDHRALCLEIILNHFGSNQLHEFVQNGGYRILRRWLKNAEERDLVDEMSSILKICSILPFDTNAVKQSEIGKMIKKLQKFQLSKESTIHAVDINHFHKQVNQLMDQWKEQIASSKSKQPVSVEQSKVVTKPKDVAAASSIRSNNGLDKVEPAPQPAVKTEQEPVAGNAPTKSTNLASANSTLAEKIRSNMKLMKEAEAEMAKDNGISEAKVDEDNRNEGAMEIGYHPEPASESDEMEVVKFEAVAVVQPVEPVKPAPRKIDRKPLDMIEGARKLLSERPQPSQKDNNLLDELKMQNDSSLSEVKPLAKGGLKKKGVTKPKISIRWADDEGGMLREIRTIEVEKIKSSVANYKTHKDLVKKEKQLEKDIISMKTTDAMQRTTEWRT